MYARCSSRRSRGQSLRGLGACNAPSLTSAALKTGASVGAGIGASLATGTAIGGPIGTAVGAVVGLVLSFLPKTSACAKESQDPETFLKCWGHSIPDNFIPEWDPNKCGWFRWVMCPGAVGGHYPATGCGPCDNPPGGKTGYSGGLWTCWQGTEIVPGTPAWGTTAEQASALSPDISGQSLVSLLEKVSPMWYVAGGATLLLLLRRRRSYE